MKQSSFKLHSDLELHLQVMKNADHVALNVCTNADHVALNICTIPQYTLSVNYIQYTIEIRVQYECLTNAN